MFIIFFDFFINGHKNANKQNIIKNNDTGLSKNFDHEPLLIIRDLLKFSSKTGPNIFGQVQWDSLILFHLLIQNYFSTKECFPGEIDLDFFYCN